MNASSKVIVSPKEAEVYFNSDQTTEDQDRFTTQLDHLIMLSRAQNMVNEREQLGQVAVWIFQTSIQDANR